MLLDIDSVKDMAHNNEPVDKSLFISTISSCKWYGPYKHVPSERYYFLSLLESGDNEYYIEFQIFIHTTGDKYLFLTRLRNDSIIGTQEMIC